jgi:hypothetical protein
VRDWTEFPQGRLGGQRERESLPLGARRARYDAKVEDRRANEADLARVSGPGRFVGHRRARHRDDAQEKGTVFQGSGPGRGGADRGRSVGWRPASYRDIPPDKLIWRR